MSSSYSTPLEELPNNQDHSQVQDQFVDDFLKEMEVPPHQESNINTEMMGYSTDQSQIPPERMNQNFLNASNNHKETNEQHTENKNLPSYENLIGGNSSTETKLKWIINLIKLPLSVFIITFILSLPHFNRFVFNLLPNLLLESGQVSIYGVLLKSIIALVLYVIVSYFL